MSPLTQSGSSTIAGADLRRKPSTSKMQRIKTVVGLWFFRRRTRQQLSELDTHLLEDIGVTHAQAQKEASRPFWQG
ncbi:DUF1127 domain-containing protein [Pseudodonghicola flavimaris]